MNRLQTAFDKGPQFIAYITAGDGGLDFTLNAMHGLVEGGVDIIEVGVPFSDPMADGPVIQRGMTRALSTDTNLDAILSLVTSFREKSDTPVVLFSYYNPIFNIISKTSTEDFCKKIKAAGVDGLLIVDCPLEESYPVFQACNTQGIDFIQLITPSTPEGRIKQICEQASGFVYYVCRKGTTGERAGLPDDVKARCDLIHSKTSLPVAVGFGIGDKQSAADALEGGEGFVVGSYFVRAIEEGATPDKLSELTKTIDPR